MSVDPSRARASTAVGTAVRRAAVARDAGLRRIAAVTRWTVAAIVVLTGALALIAAKAFPGHSVSSTRASVTPASTPATTTPTTTTPTTTTTPELQQPAQAPASTQQAPVATSGGS